jgi:hypothetical protein
MATASVSKSGLGATQQHLASVIGTAKRLGYHHLEYEARLALGELEVKINSSSAHKHLTSLASETRILGLELLARRAENAMASGALEAQNRSTH